MSAERNVKICFKCGVENESIHYYCNVCGSRLGHDIDSRYLPTPQKPPNAVCITCIVLVCVFLFAIISFGVLFIFITSISDTPSTGLLSYGISAIDAEANATGNTFDPGEDLISITHMTSPEINWSKMIRMRCKIIGQEVEYDLYLKSVKGILYQNDSANAISNPSEVVILSLKFGTIPTGSIISIMIYASGYQWNSPHAGIRVM